MFLNDRSMDYTKRQISESISFIKSRDVPDIDARAADAQDRLWTAEIAWKTLANATQSCPMSEYSSYFGNDFHVLVLAHLPDRGKHFVYVLQCFTAWLRYKGRDLWKNERPQGGLSRLSTILHNPAFHSSIQDESKGHRDGADPHSLSWLEDYFVSLDSEHMRSQRYDVAATIAAFLCETLQAESYNDALKASCIQAGCAFLLRILQEDALSSKDFSNITNIQSTNIALTALAIRRDQPPWHSARTRCREFMYSVLERDVGLISRHAVQHSPAQRSQKESLPVCHVLWKRCYDELALNDIATIASLTIAISQNSTIEVSSQIEQDELSVLDHAIISVRDPFPDLLQNFSQNGNNVLHTYLKMPRVCLSILKLMFSQIPRLHDAAFSIVRETFDVVNRADCFLSMLKNFPDAGLEALSTILVEFQTAADHLPQFGDAARWLVRCTGDCVNALCSQHDGLFNDTSFYLQCKSVSGIAALVWRDLWAALSVFFKNAAKWSTARARETMVEWMLEAQVLVDRIISDLPIFHAATHGQTSADYLFSNADETEGTGVEVLLQDVLLAFDSILRWLAITDIELLDNTVVLVCKILNTFEDHGVSVPEPTLKRILGYTETQESGKNRSRMTSDQKSRLSRATSSHLDLEYIAEVSESKQSSSKPQVMPSWWNQLKQSPKSVRGFKQPNAIHSIEEDYEFDNIGLSDAQLAKMLDDAESKAAMQLSAKHKMPSTGSVIDSIVARQQRVDNNAAKTRTGLTSRTGTSDSAPSTLSITSLRKSLIEERRDHLTQPRFGAAPMRNVLPKRTDERIYNDSKAPSPSKSDDEEDGPLVSALAKFAPSKPAVRIKHAPEVKRSVKLLDGESMQGFRPGQNQSVMKKRREERNARLRLTPDMSGLYRSLLIMDYKHSGDLPSTMTISNVRNVPMTFSNADEYEEVMAPLLLLETWQQVLRAKEELDPRQRLNASITGRLAADDFLILHIDVKNMPPRFIFDTDVVVLHEADSPLTTNLDHSKRSIMAKVESIASRGPSTEAKLKCFLGSDAKGNGPALHPGSHWILERLFNFTTSLREWAAMKSIRYYDLCSAILSPASRSFQSPSPEAVLECVRNQKVNEPQAEAILGALGATGINLIQGPPGTGKTKTICALIGAYISSYERSTAEAPLIGTSQMPHGRKLMKPLLLCAPSNAAVDEVARRLLTGTRDSSGRRFIPRIVRVGATDAVGISVKSVILDELVEKEAAAESGASGAKGVSKADNSALIAELRAKIDSINKERSEKQAEITDNQHTTSKMQALDAEIKALTAERIRLYQRLDSEKDKQQSTARLADALRRRLRLKILSEAHVICSTLAGSGTDELQKVSEGFETVIIDEAAQSVETSALIPLRYGCTKCIMVGDPQQLPPTVTSQVAAGKGYNQSLFVRLMKYEKQSVHLLSIQYRMHPNISKFPSKIFYDGRLADGPHMTELTSQPWHENPKFPPYALFNVIGKEEIGQYHSIRNKSEALIAQALYQGLKANFPAVNFDYRIGIIATYKAQLAELKKIFSAKYGRDILTKIDFNTVDGFQGQEKDIIILSCVRGGIDTGIGFLKDQRRLNVGLTRAKCSLFILGNVAALKRDPFWAKLVNDAIERKVLFEANGQAFFPSQKPIESPDSKSKKRRGKAEDDTALRSDSKLIEPLMTPADFNKDTKARLNWSSKRSKPSSDIQSDGVTYSNSSKPIQNDRHSQQALPGLALQERSTGLVSSSSLQDSIPGLSTSLAPTAQSGPVRHGTTSKPASMYNPSNNQDSAALGPRKRHRDAPINEIDAGFLPYESDGPSAVRSAPQDIKGIPIPMPGAKQPPMANASEPTAPLESRPRPKRQVNLFIPKRRPAAGNAHAPVADRRHAVEIKRPG